MTALFVACGGADSETATRATAQSEQRDVKAIVSEELSSSGYPVRVVECDPDPAGSSSTTENYKCVVENTETSERETINAALFPGSGHTVDTSLIRRWLSN